MAEKRNVKESARRKADQPPVDGKVHVQSSPLAARCPRKHSPIVRLPGVCGGDPCIAGTRIPVWVLERARQLGASQEKLLRMYPDLCAQDLANAWRYVRSHATEIERQIRENEAF
jgi:uncharacterized protein (DUF433 family)